jgi:CRISPR-associated protein Cas1
MFSNKDIAYRQIFVINGLENRKIRLVNFQLGLYDTEEEKFLTKIPFSKILALFIVGHATLTTPLIERCNKNGISVVVVKPNFRLVFCYGKIAEGNYLLRQQQYFFPKQNMTIAKILMLSKIQNHRRLLQKTRKKSALFTHAFSVCDHTLEELDKQTELKHILALEGKAAKAFFKAYFNDFDWTGRKQRTKTDMVNAILDVGYTILFNYVECMLRLFGFDLYVGVYHQLWFQRKSLVCDLVEPFRGLIDQATRKNINYKKFQKSDFDIRQNRYYLKRSCSQKYYEAYYKEVIHYKNEIFLFIRQYYRCFMGRKSAKDYPIFELK